MRWKVGLLKDGDFGLVCGDVWVCGYRLGVRCVT